jgi:hypothetical protein
MIECGGRWAKPGQDGKHWMVVGGDDQEFKFPKQFSVIS